MTSRRPLKIGMSLTPTYLADQPDSADRQWYGPVEPFLAALREAGVTHIEIRAVHPSTDEALAHAALDRVWDQGLDATVHGSLPPASAGEDWASTISPLISVLERITQRDAATLCPVAVHAYADRVGDAAALADQSVARLGQMAQWVERRGLAALFALEINRAKGQVDPGVTFQGVLDMYQRVNHPRVGVCWDMGHTWSNMTRGLLPPAPPPAFLAAVRHTHIHDLGPTSVTHWPLTEERMPLERFVTDLAAAGYDGVWNLELEPQRYADEAQIRQRVIRSVQRLIQTLTSDP